MATTVQVLQTLRRMHDLTSYFHIHKLQWKYSVNRIIQLFKPLHFQSGICVHGCVYVSKQSLIYLIWFSVCYIYSCYYLCLFIFSYIIHKVVNISVNIICVYHFSFSEQIFFPLPILFQSFALLFNQRNQRHYGPQNSSLGLPEAWNLWTNLTLVMTLWTEAPFCQKRRLKRKNHCPSPDRLPHWEWICLHLFSVLIASQSYVKPLHIPVDPQAERILHQFLRGSNFILTFHPHGFLGRS